MSTFLITIVALVAAVQLATVSIVNGCSRVRVEWSVDDGRMNVLFHVQPSLSLTSNRPIFYSHEPHQLYLYHMIVAPEIGMARWLIGHETETNKCIAYIDSWAVSPHVTHTVSPQSRWEVYDTTGWHTDATANITCVGEDDDDDDEEEGEGSGDTSVYVCSELNPVVCGFYFPISSAAMPVYRSVDLLNLYPVNNRWFISHDAPGARSGVAFIDCPARTPNLIPAECPDRRWNVFTSKNNGGDDHDEAAASEWQEDANWVMFTPSSSSSSSNDSHHHTTTNVHEMLRTHWFNSRDSDHHNVVMNNGVHIPTVGLGTGGWTRAQNEQTLPLAMNTGYRLIDSASEYHNEDIIGRVLAGTSSSNLRHHVTITTKLWPTRLGFAATLQSFDESLHRLRSGYVDVYMLHWPECYSHFTWMDCSQRMNEEGTWQHSWRALERLYAEGKVRAIGVSNFNAHLLEQVIEMAHIKPQIVQNYFDPLHTDDDVLNVCRQHGIVYQAYSVLRNVARVSPPAEYQPVWQAARDIGRRVQKDPAQVILRWALQYGAERGVQMSVIPRSTQSRRLLTNLHASDESWHLDRQHMNIFAHLLTTSTALKPPPAASSSSKEEL